MTYQSPVKIEQGAFSVSTSGEAVYRLPIELPPGIAGCAPTLALEYGHRNAHGYCGIGWSVSGESSISRMPAIEAIDQFRGTISFDADDRLAIDGERLIQIDGDYLGPETVYYKERHDWTRISTRSGLTNGFTARLKNGEVRSYGTTADSRFSPVGATEVLSWALAKHQDLNGNAINYAYTNAPVPGMPSSENYYLSSISYAAEVTFHYEKDPNGPSIHYVAGCPVTTSCRLKSIQVALPVGTAVKTYGLHYQPSPATGLSQLASISVTGADGQSLPPLSFQWTGAAPSAAPAPAGADFIAPGDGIQTIPMDIGGDGVTDFVQLFSRSGTLTAQIYNAGAGGSYSPGSSVPLAAYGDDYQVCSGDVRGCGKKDLIVVYPKRNTQNRLMTTVDVYLSDGAGFSATPNTTTTQIPWICQADRIGIYAMDLDGDGRTDLAIAYRRPGNGMASLSFIGLLSQFAGSSSGFGAQAVDTSVQIPASAVELLSFDVNGDGLIDLVLLGTDDTNGSPELVLTAFVSRDEPGSGLSLFSTTVTTRTGLTTRGQIAILPADSNGDGRTDIVQIGDDGSGNLIIQPLISTGDGGFASVPKSIFSHMTVSADQEFYPLALNGGALASLAFIWSDENQVRYYTAFRSSPSGAYTKAQTVTLGNIDPAAQVYIGDANGDGRSDLLFLYETQNHDGGLLPLLSAGDYPDLMSSVTDMLGNQTTISYAPLTDSAVYSAGGPVYPQSTSRRYPTSLSPAQYPIETVLGEAIYVVSAYESAATPANRFAHSRHVRMTYGNGIIDLNGRGWLGFQKVSSLNVLTGRRETKTFEQSFPLTGRVASISIFDAGTGQPQAPELLRKTVNVYDQVQIPAEPSDGTPYFQVRKAGILKYRYAVSNVDDLVAEQYQYDSYGNRKSTIWWGYITPIQPTDAMSTAPFPTVTPSDRSKVVWTYRQFLNSETDWVLGLVTCEKQSSNHTDSDPHNFSIGDITFSENHYFPDTYLLKSHAKYDDGNQVNLTWAYTYDQYGNKLTETVPGGATTTYEYETTYNLYLAKVTHPQVDSNPPLTTLHGFDPRFGKQVAHRDENGHFHIAALDGFGRQILSQGPIPPGYSQSDQNEVTSLVTGDAAVKTAPVLTLQKIAYKQDGNGEIYLEHSVLQAFPTDSARNFDVSRTYIDGLHRKRLEMQIRTATARNPATLTDYADCGRVGTRTVPFFLPIPLPENIPDQSKASYTYDVLGRMRSATVPTGRNDTATSETTWCYRAGGLVVVTEAKGTPAQYQTKITKRLIHGKEKNVQSIVEQDSNATTSCSFDRLGRLVESQDPIGVTNLMRYDSLGRLVTCDNPDQNTTGNSNISALQYAYDPDTGVIRSVENAAGQKLLYEHDALGRMIQRSNTLDDRIDTFEYDDPSDPSKNRMGRVSRASVNGNPAGGLTKEFAYDCYGNTSVEKTTYDGEPAPFEFSSVFDPRKRLISRTFPDGSVMRSAYQDCLLTEQSLGSLRVEYPVTQYSPGGYPNSISYGQRIAAEFTRNKLDIPYAESLHLDDSQITLLDFSFEYDALQQLVTEKEFVSGNAERFTYAAKRLTEVHRSDPAETHSSYTYDPGGNFKTKDGDRYSQYQGHFPGEVTSQSGEVSCRVTQDACGRMVARDRNGMSLSFAYDVAGNLTKVSNGTDQLRSFLVDAYDRRVGEERSDGSRILYVSPDYEILRRHGRPDEVRIYIEGHGGIVAAKIGETELYFRNDIKSSVTHGLRQDGTIHTIMSYDGFGTLRLLEGTEQIPISYEGKSYDSTTGLYHFGARDYDPWLGRFITPDTYVGAHDYLRADGWNRFAFELNCPIMYLDPSGHFSWNIFNDVMQITADVAEIAAGAAIIALTGGAAANVAGSTLIGAGVGGLSYDINTLAEHKKVSWNGWGIKEGVGATTGLLTGGAAVGTSELLDSAAVEGTALSSTFGRSLAMGTTMGAVGAGTSVLGGVINNAAAGKSLGSGLGIDAIAGGVAGFLGGAGSGFLKAGALAGDRYAGEVSEAFESSPIFRGRMPATAISLRLMSKGQRAIFLSSPRFTFGSVKMLLSPYLP